MDNPTFQGSFLFAQAGLRMATLFAKRPTARAILMFGDPDTLLISLYAFGDDVDR